MIIKNIRQGIGRGDGTLRILGIWDTTLQQGEGIRPHLHRGVEEAYYIIEGEGEMFLQGESREVRAGDLVYIPPESVHFIKTKGQQSLRLITVSIDVGGGLGEFGHQPGHRSMWLSKN